MQNNYSPATNTVVRAPTAIPKVGIVVCVVGGVLLVLIFIAFILYRHRQKQQRTRKNTEDSSTLPLVRTDEDDRKLDDSLRRLRHLHPKDTSMSTANETFLFTPMKKSQQKLSIPPPSISTVPQQITVCEPLKEPIDFPAHLQQSMDLLDDFDVVQEQGNSIPSINPHVTAFPNIRPASIPYGSPISTRSRSKGSKGHSGSNGAPPKKKRSQPGHSSSPEFEMVHNDVSMLERSGSLGSLTSSSGSSGSAPGSSTPQSNRSSPRGNGQADRQHGLNRQSDQGKSLLQNMPPAIATKSKDGAIEMRMQRDPPQKDVELSTSVQQSDLTAMFPQTKHLEVQSPSTAAPKPSVESVPVLNSPADPSGFVVVNNVLVRSKESATERGRAQAHRSVTSFHVNSMSVKLPLNGGQSDQSLGTLSFSVLYSTPVSTLKLHIISARNLSLDRNNQPPRTFIKIELSTGSRKDTASCETVVHTSTRNPHFDEKIFFKDYWKDEIKHCTLQLKVYHQPQAAVGDPKPNRQRLGIVRLPLKSITLDEELHLTRPLEPNTDRKSR